jgi:transposase
MATLDNDMRVLGYIVQYRAEHDGHSPSIREIAQETGIKRSTVQNAVGRLLSNYLKTWYATGMNNQPNPLPTIWRIPDDLWVMIQPILAELDPPKKTGRKRIDSQAALDAMIFRLRSGCQWNQLPKEFPDDSSVHRTFQRWVERGVFDRIWAVLVEACNELGGVDWRWQAADGALSKARFGGIRSAETRRIAANMEPSAAC